MHLGSFFLFKIHITNIAIVFIIATIDHQHHQGGGSEPFRALKGETRGPGGTPLKQGSRKVVALSLHFMWENPPRPLQPPHPRPPPPYHHN